MNTPGIGVSLEVIRSDFAPGEKPNTTKGQRDNKRLQSQAERSSISSLCSIWVTFANFLFQAHRHKTEHLLMVSMGPECMTYAHEAAWMSSSDRFNRTLLMYRSDIFVCFNSNL